MTASSRNAQWAVRAKFDRKIADFVIGERGTLKTVAGRGGCLHKYPDLSRVLFGPKLRSSVTLVA
jgi:hypothetical protein